MVYSFGRYEEPIFKTGAAQTLLLSLDAEPGEGTAQVGWRIPEFQRPRQYIENTNLSLNVIPRPALGSRKAENLKDRQAQKNCSHRGHSHADASRFEALTDGHQQ